MTQVRSYKDLRVWQQAMDFVVVLYTMTDSFPKSEQFGLTNQMRRAAVSIPSNIAEGHVRSRKEFSRFLQIALGSLAELETQMELAQRIGYLPLEKYNNLNEKINHIGRQLNVLTQKIRG